MDSKFTKLSKGCQLCQQGTWLCIYLTYKCSASCHFCPSPFKDDRIHSSFGNTKEEIIIYLSKSEMKGISFSGGDPFLVYNRLLEWLTFFNNKLFDYYYWVYTNGTHVNEQKLKALAEEGMHEIRFNIAATDYLSPEIWRQIEYARKHFQFVTIEIPSIRKDFEKLRKALHMAYDIGIDFINLHDYIISPENIQTEEEALDEFILNMSFAIHYSRASIENTYAIKEYSQHNDFSFNINHCSLQQKEEQLWQRRLKTGAMFDNPLYDHWTDDGLIYNYFLFPSEFNSERMEAILIDTEMENRSENYMLSKNEIDNWHQQDETMKLVQATYIPKMDVNGNKLLIDWQINYALRQAHL